LKLSDLLSKAFGLRIGLASIAAGTFLRLGFRLERRKLALICIFLRRGDKGMRWSLCGVSIGRFSGRRMKKKRGKGLKGEFFFENVKRLIKD